MIRRYAHVSCGTADGYTDETVAQDFLRLGPDIDRVHWADDDALALAVEPEALGAALNRRPVRSRRARSLRPRIPVRMRRISRSWS